MHIIIPLLYCYLCLLKTLQVMGACSVMSDSVQLYGLCQAPLFVGFSRQEYWSGLPYPPAGDLSEPEIEPTSPALQADSLLLSHREALCKRYLVVIF